MLATKLSILPITRIGSILSEKLQLRHGSFYGSPFLEDLDPVKVPYDVTREPVDWKYVERCLPLTVIPEPIMKDHYPSGWKPQQPNLQDRPYYVKRTKNHMIPCYMSLTRQWTKRTTILKFIQGDIWQLEKELRAFLQPQYTKPLSLQVNEFAGYIRLRGDYVNAIKYFLERKGY